MANKKNDKSSSEKDATERLTDVINLSKKKLVERAKTFSKEFSVGDGDKFKLKDYKTTADFDFDPTDKNLIQETLQLGISAMATMQDILYAQDNWSLLIVFQAMDAAGKDGAIKHVMSGVNPQGCQVSSFKAPSSEDLDHDFLWRCQKHLPERGKIGIFNRSYYEEVLVVRVHEAILQAQKIPEKFIDKNIWKERFEDIRNFEKYLHRNGTVVIKFFLHVSKDEQKKRFIDRVDDPDKNWKFSSSDAKEREYWDDYMDAYEDLIKHTSTEKSPWYIVPADNKNFARIVIASAIIKALDNMNLEYPKVSDEKIAELNEIKAQLLKEK